MDARAIVLLLLTMTASTAQGQSPSRAFDCAAGGPPEPPQRSELVTSGLPISPLQPVAGVFPEIRPAKPLSAAEERALQPADLFKECDHCPEMVVVPAGEFMMGSPALEPSGDDDERPQHRVLLAKPFAVGRFAVTFAEWDACVADGGCKRYRPGDRGWGRGRQPVINLWWEDARAYVAWLSERTGRTYRLLSEAEREYVMRAATTTPFWWGATISTEHANYDGDFTYGWGPRANTGARRWR